MKRAGEVLDMAAVRARLEACRDRASHRAPENVVDLAELQREAKIPPRYVSARLETVPFARALRVWADTPAGRCALLWGPTGTGKTYGACALANDVLARGGSARFVRAIDLADEARADYGRARALFEFALWGRLVVLDDLGAELLADGRQDAGRRRVADLVHQRHDEMRATVITTNLSPRQLAELDARLASRIIGGAVGLHVDGPDRRLGGGR